jgi:hypothetical protein
VETKSALATFGITTIGRSAGPLWTEAHTLGSVHFEHYWKTGLTSNDKKQVAAATFLNPTFAYSMSGRGFSLHYGTDPILAFHLAETFAPTKAASGKNTVTMRDLTASVKSQFQAWCSAFRARLTNESTTHTIVIRMFTGDALAFSRALHHCAQSHSIESGIYISTWGSGQIILDGGDYGKIAVSNGAPLTYDVIDTSNVTDHVGLLNILIATIPLLRNTSSAALHTNYLLPNHGRTPPSPNKLEERACADIATLALFLGVVPTSYVSNFTAQSNVHEVSNIDPSNLTLHEVVSWKRLPVVADYDLIQPLVYNPLQLATLLFDIYLKMFSDEMLPQLNIADPASFLRQFDLHYVRATFVALLQLIRNRVSTKWDQAMEHLLDLIGNNKMLFVGLNYYQDLMCQLHIRGVYSCDILVSPPSRLGHQTDFFRQWNVVPPTICIVLKVPRTALKVVEEMDPDKIGTPILHCEVNGPGFQNMFSSLQFFFGNVTLSGVGLQRTLDLKEDDVDSQWNGSSPLIVSFHMPSWILNRNPSATRIVLSVRGTPAALQVLLPKLGLELCLFSASLTDSRHVYVVRERPNNALELNNLSSMTAHHSSELSRGAITVRMENGGRKASGFTMRTNITDSEKRNALTNKAVVTVKQVSPYGLLATLGQFHQNIIFPFPIDSSNYKVRVARKLFYIEVSSGFIIFFISFRK